MDEIHLLRCKAESLPQRDAFAVDAKPADVIVRSFLARPTAKVPRGSTWHIGNAEVMPNATVYFALGREAILRSSEFDEELRDFKEVEQKHAPFTVGVFDPSDQTIGVVVRPGVSLSAREIASKLEILLAEPGIARQANRKISVDYISDPTGFIEAIESAHRVTRFEFSFTLPNPPKDEKYIQRPMKEFAERADATEGKASIKGDNLDKEEISEIAAAIAASGDDAVASLQMTPKAKITRKRLRLSAIREDVDLLAADSVAVSILQSMQSAFEGVRDLYRDRSND
jgi:hypothetical protein